MMEQPAAKCSITCRVRTGLRGKMTATSILDTDLTRDEVLEQLDRIVLDKRFCSADRNSRFLRYVVEKTLEGRTDEIKEIVIATEIYGRSTDYDPKIDSIVR